MKIHQQSFPGSQAAGSGATWIKRRRLTGFAGRGFRAFGKRQPSITRRENLNFSFLFSTNVLAVFYRKVLFYSLLSTPKTPQDLFRPSSRQRKAEP